LLPSCNKGKFQYENYHQPHTIGLMGVPREITTLLKAWQQGDSTALAHLVPLVEAELHRLAHRYLAQERPGHILQTTALVNEAYLRLMDWKKVEWQDRAHFIGVAARLMRYVLVGYAKRQPYLTAATRQVSLDEVLGVSPKRTADLVALDDALNALAAFDPRKSQIVELRFFGGLSVEETAEVLNVAPITVMREWNKAKAWLYDELSSKRS
jgi:RNA polymerase sigma factor (TIGR02999 family)